jgi:hypothetical protein
MIQGKVLFVGAAAVLAFLITAFLLGTPVLFVVVVFLIGPHGAGILPEWSHIPVLALCAGGVGYISFKVAFWAQMTLANRMSAI